MNTEVTRATEDLVTDKRKLIKGISAGYQFRVIGTVGVE